MNFLFDFLFVLFYLLRMNKTEQELIYQSINRLNQRPTINKCMTSLLLTYYVKRQLMKQTNNAITYVSNDDVIFAMKKAGFKTYYVSDKTENCYFNLSYLNVRKVFADVLND